MARRSYNGFTPSERSTVARWNRKVGWPQGLIPKVRSYCQGCHLSNVTIKGHSEDYNRPETFWSLCGRCHHWVHRRFRNWEGFVRYLDGKPSDSVLRKLTREEPNYNPDGLHPRFAKMIA